MEFDRRGTTPYPCLMAKLFRRTAYLLLAVACTAGTAKARTISENYILIINSYTESSVWSNRLIDPIYSDFFKKNIAETICVEHMNMLAVESTEDIARFTDLLVAKYGHRRPNTVVFLGNSAWRLLVDDLRQRWNDVPVILCAEQPFIGYEKYYLTKQAIPRQERISIEGYNEGRPMCMILMPFYPKETLRLMRTMMPGLKHVWFLSDMRQRSSEIRQQVRRVVAEDFPGLEVTCLTPETTDVDSLVRITNTPAPNSAVLFSSWHVREKEFGTVLAARVAEMIGSNSAVPIFMLENEAEAEKGLLGGCYLSEEERSYMLLEAIHRSLGGGITDFSAAGRYIPPPPVICYPDLLHYGFTQDNCPPNTVFILKPPSFLAQHKSLFLMLISIGLLLAWSIVWLFRSRREQRHKLDMIQDYNTLFNWMPIGYARQRLILDDQGRVTDYYNEHTNPEYVKTFGDKPLGSQNGYPDWDRITQYYTRLHDTGKMTSIEYTMPSGERCIHISLHASYKPGYVELFCSDVTELATAQDMLRSANNQLALALDVANIIPWKWDLKKGMIFYDVNRLIGLVDLKNPPAEGQLAVPQERYFRNIHPDDKERIHSSFADLVEGRAEKIREEYRVLVRRKGLTDYDWVEAKVIAEERGPDGRATSLVGSSLVITKRKAMEQDLIDSRMQAEEANRLKSAFLANMSHEIRTPLNAIVGFSEVLASAESPEERDEYISIIENNNALLLQLIGDILDLSKIEAGTLEYNYSDFDLNAAFREMETSARARRIFPEVEILYAAEMPDCYIHSDKNRLCQVVINLLNNAIKFTSQGSIDFGYRLRDGQLYCYVKDTGAGIPESKLDSVFGRFVKLNNFAQGTGLGLAICRSIVEGLGGEIGVESKEGEGSTFWFTLPYHPAVRNEERRESEKTCIPGMGDDKMTVLVAEDNESNFRLFESILRENYHVLHAWNGVEAVELFSAHNPHIVIMDIDMPEMDGYETTKIIRGLSPTVPIMAVTAFAYAEDEKHILESGFDAYIAKPVNAGNLKQQLVQLLKNRFTFM